MKALLKRKLVNSIKQLDAAILTSNNATDKANLENSCRLALELKRILEASPFNEDECEKKLVELQWLKR